MVEFAPARALYMRHGFECRGPFDNYIEDLNSVFMIKILQTWQTSEASLERLIHEDLPVITPVRSSFASTNRRTCSQTVLEK